MEAEMIELMSTQVRAIHRALTGSDVPDTEPSPTSSPPVAPEIVMQHFVELEAAVRSIPTVSTRVAPFAFTPPLDVIAGDDAVIVELAIPGVARDDIELERAPDALIVRGVRRDPHGGEGRAFHAEIPRGPFARVIPLPFPLAEDPRFELDRGVLRIQLVAGAATSTAPPASPEDPRRQR